MCQWNNGASKSSPIWTAPSVPGQRMPNAKAFAMTIGRGVTPCGAEMADFDSFRRCISVQNCAALRASPNARGRLRLSACVRWPHPRESANRMTPQSGIPAERSATRRQVGQPAHKADPRSLRTTKPRSLINLRSRRYAALMTKHRGSQHVGRG
jgi:hypothetical protein